MGFPSLSVWEQILYTSYKLIGNMTMFMSSIIHTVVIASTSKAPQLLEAERKVLTPKIIRECPAKPGVI